MTNSDKVVCFDIGGVLVRIRQTWDQAVLAVQRPVEPFHEVSLNSFLGLLSYQEGTLGEKEYLDELAGWLRLSSEDAVLVHQAILDCDYPGAELFVKSLQVAGVYTCCFSNTNALHWKFLTDPLHHPAVASLDMKIASHEISAAKPDLDAFDRVDKMLPPHQRVIFFDDTPENVVAARKFGWTSFQIDPKGNPVIQMKETLAKLGEGL